MTDRPIESSAMSNKAVQLPALAAMTSPLLALAIAILACAGLLMLPIALPLGPMYWDVALYLDADNRIRSGQIPVVDFFTPVGPLGYWLYSGLGRLFVQAQPLLLAQWSLFLVTAVPMALILREVDARSRTAAFGLLLPYLMFQILPLNIEQYSVFPGFDGYGIYNRQISIVLYVLAAAVMFLRDRRVLTGVLVWTLLALLLIKVTGFVAGGLIVAVALFAGRIDLRQSLLVAGLFCLPLIALEFSHGVVSAYIGSIIELLGLNSGTILQRFVQAGSLHLDIVACGSALLATLTVLSWSQIRDAADRLWRERSGAALRQLLDRDIVWLGVVLFAGLFVETQNTGGQAFIFAWPVLLSILLASRDRRGAVVVLALIAATTLPPAVSVLHRAGRAVLAQTGYVALPHEHLGRLGQVSQHRDVMKRADQMLSVYAGHRPTFQAISDHGMLPSSMLYSDLDFQAAWLRAIDLGITEILRYEAANGVRFQTIMNINFANVFPALMNRTGVGHITIGADPYRAIPAPDSETIAAIGAADLILHPQCPITSANEEILKRYASAMTGRREIALGGCWKGYMKAK